MDFEEALLRLGFRRTDERSGRGAVIYRADPGEYLTYWVHSYEDGTALFTWELAIVDLLAGHGFQLGSSESLNTFMFPMEDDRGPQDGAWLAAAIDRVEERLRALRFDPSEPEQ